MRHGTTAEGLFQQSQAHSPSSFSVLRAKGRFAELTVHPSQANFLPGSPAREPERPIS